MMAKRFSALPLLFTAGAMMMVPALAQGKKQSTDKENGIFRISTAGDWGAYFSGKEKARVCYAMSQPKERLPKGLTRDPAYLFITSKGGGRFELSVVMGYPLKPGVLANATIGTDKYELLTKDKSAWLKRESDEKDVVASIRAGSAMIIKGTSAKGNETSDRYSLAGAGSAIERMQKECQ